MTQIEIILLALLYDKDCHGYEFEQIIEKEKMRMWTHIGFSSIYNALNKLEHCDYIVSRLEKGNGSSSKRVYSIKDESKKIVKENIKKMISEYKSNPNDFKIGFIFSYLLSKDELNEALTKHKQSLIERKENLNNEQLNVVKSEERKALFERTISFLETDILWLDKCIKQSSNMKSK